MMNPKVKIRSWLSSIREAIAVAKSKREFEKVLKNRPYNIVQCGAAHRLAEHVPIELTGTLSWGGTISGLPELDEGPEKIDRVYPWFKFQIDVNRISGISYNLGDPIDIIQRAAIKEHGRVGDTYHLIPMESGGFPPLFVRIGRTEDGTDITWRYGFLRHRNSAAYINCMECHNYASDWLNRMVIPGSPTDEKPLKVGPFARLFVWAMLLFWAVRGIGLTSDLADTYSHIETAIEWLTPGI